MPWLSREDRTIILATIPEAPNSPTSVLLIYFKPKTRYYLHASSPKIVGLSLRGQPQEGPAVQGAQSIEAPLGVLSPLHGPGCVMLGADVHASRDQLTQVEDAADVRVLRLVLALSSLQPLVVGP